MLTFLLICLSGGISNILSAIVVNPPSAEKPLLIAQVKFCLSSAGLPKPLISICASHKKPASITVFLFYQQMKYPKFYKLFACKRRGHRVLFPNNKVAACQLRLI